MSESSSLTRERISIGMPFLGALFAMLMGKTEHDERRLQAISSRAGRQEHPKHGKPSRFDNNSTTLASQ